MRKAIIELSAAQHTEYRIIVNPTEYIGSSWFMCMCCGVHVCQCYQKSAGLFHYHDAGMGHIFVPAAD